MILHSFGTGYKKTRPSHGRGPGRVAGFLALSDHTSAPRAQSRPSASPVGRAGMHIIMHIKKAEPRIAGRIGSNDLQKK